MFVCLLFFFFKQKTAYEMRISDWSSDVCSSDLFGVAKLAFLDRREHVANRDLVVDVDLGQRMGFGFGALCRARARALHDVLDHLDQEIGRASCRERVCQYV